MSTKNLLALIEVSRAVRYRTPNPPPSPAPPVNVILPSVYGQKAVGNELVVNKGTWLGSYPQTYTFQWKRDGANIVGETDYIYTVVLADQFAELSVVVTAHNASLIDVSIEISVDDNFITQRDDQTIFTRSGASIYTRF